MNDEMKKLIEQHDLLEHQITLLEDQSVDLEYEILKKDFLEKIDDIKYKRIIRRTLDFYDNEKHKN